MENKHKIEYLFNYGKENNVPITDEKTLREIINQLQKKKITNLLEIGTAIGYSTLVFYENFACTVYSIERDKERYQIAHKYLNDIDDIILFNEDALSIDCSNFPKFDVIYFDAAKSQNIKFFEKYHSYLNIGGLILVDNLYFHGFVNSNEKIESKNLRQMVRKIKDFITFMDNHNNYSLEILEIGDGLGIIRRIND